MSRWGIACPGPSLEAQADRMFFDNLDHLIAVNGAILLPHQHYDYWAVIDIEVFITCLAVRQRYNNDLVLWVPRRWVNDLSFGNSMGQAFRSFSREMFPGNSNEEFAEIMPFGKDIQWRERTLFVAIALAVLKGAKEIILYGVDMRNAGYFKPGLENCRTRHTPKRWEEELSWFNQIVETCAENGILITRTAIGVHEQ